MKKNVQIAFLIMAHNQPRHLHRLVSALNNKNFHFFIHIDAKSDQNEFLKYEYPQNIHFLSERTKVFHSGFSVVEAMLSLLSTAYNNPGIDYFYFLSGWDYLIKKPKHIFNYLEQSYPKNFISFYPLIDGTDCVDHIHKFFFIDVIGNAPVCFQFLLRVIQRLALHSPVNRRFLPGITPYRGSAWFCINRETVKHIFTYMDKPESIPLINYMNTVCAPDEIFFHTIILNSYCVSYCNMYEEDNNFPRKFLKNENKAYLHYIDWDEKRENPALLDMRDFDKIQSSTALFARKFHEKKSAELLEAIDRMIS